MIGYVTVGTNDPEASVAFFDAVLIPLELKRKFFDKESGWAGYGPPDSPDDDVQVCICPPYNGEEATVGNGSMVAFRAPSKEKVDEAWKAGIANGGTDEGRPGFRPEDSERFYGSYLRDPMGNKFAIFWVNLA